MTPSTDLEFRARSTCLCACLHQSQQRFHKLSFQKFFSLSTFFPVLLMIFYHGFVRTHAFCVPKVSPVIIRNPIPQGYPGIPLLHAVLPLNKHIAICHPVDQQSALEIHSDLSHGTRWAACADCATRAKGLVLRGPSRARSLLLCGPSRAKFFASCLHWTIAEMSRLSLNQLAS